MCTRMCCASLVLFIVYAVARSNPPLTCIFLWDISEVTEQLIKKSFSASFLRVQPTNAYESAQRGSLSVTTSNKVFIRILCLKTFPYSYIQILRLNGHFWGWSVTSSVTRLTRILLKASDSREACPPSRTMSDKVPLSLTHICFSYSDNQKLNFSSAADARASQVQSKVHVSFNSSVFIKKRNTTRVQGTFYRRRDNELFLSSEAQIHYNMVRTSDHRTERKTASLSSHRDVFQLPLHTRLHSQWQNKSHKQQ